MEFEKILSSENIVVCGCDNFGRNVLNKLQTAFPKKKYSLLAFNPDGIFEREKSEQNGVNDIYIYIYILISFQNIIKIHYLLLQNPIKVLKNKFRKN